MTHATATTFADAGLGAPEVVIILAIVGVPILLVLAVVWFARRRA